jgi:excisionase family DNA binding protein
MSEQPIQSPPRGRLLTADQVAELLQVPKGWVYAQTRSGHVPAVRLGRYYRYRPEAIRKWVEDLESGKARS